MSDFERRLKRLKERQDIMRSSDVSLAETTIKSWLAMSMVDTRFLFHLLPSNKKEFITKEYYAPEVACGKSREYQLAYVNLLIPVFEKDMLEGRLRLDRRSMLKKITPILAAAVWCVVLALTDFHNEWIYQLSKWAVCSICVFIGFRFWKDGMRKWLIPLGAIAVVFNPITPILFDEDEWKIVDWIAAIALILYVPGLIHKRESNGKAKDWRSVRHFLLRRFAGLLVFCYQLVIVLGIFLAVFGIAWGWMKFNERSKPETINPNNSKERDLSLNEERKYPRAMHGGGLDWSGVEDSKLKQSRIQSDEELDK